MSRNILREKYNLRKDLLPKRVSIDFSDTTKFAKSVHNLLSKQFDPEQLTSDLLLSMFYSIGYRDIVQWHAPVYEGDVVEDSPEGESALRTYKLFRETFPSGKFLYFINRDKFKQTASHASNFDKNGSIIVVDLDGESAYKDARNAYTIRGTSVNLRVFPMKQLFVAYKVSQVLRSVNKETLVGEFRETLATYYKNQIVDSDKPDVFRESCQRQYTFVMSDYFYDNIVNYWSLGIGRPTKSFFQKRTTTDTAKAVKEVFLFFYKDLLKISYTEDYEVGVRAGYARAFETKKTVSEKVKKAMESSPFLKLGFDEVEYDTDTDLDKVKAVIRDWNAIRVSLPTSKIPATLRFRKLGNYKSAGLYFSTYKCIAIDLRSVWSMVHEYGHYIDYTADGGVGDSLSLQEGFSSIYDYYFKTLQQYRQQDIVLDYPYLLTPTEVFARAFEVWVSSLNLGSSIVYRRKDELNTLLEYIPLFDKEQEIIVYFENLVERVGKNKPVSEKDLFEDDIINEEVQSEGLVEEKESTPVKEIQTQSTIENKDLEKPSEQPNAKTAEQPTNLSTKSKENKQVLVASKSQTSFTLEEFSDTVNLRDRGYHSYVFALYHIEEGKSTGTYAYRVIATPTKLVPMTVYKYIQSMKSTNAPDMVAEVVAKFGWRVVGTGNSKALPFFTLDDTFENVTVEQEKKILDKLKRYFKRKYGV